MASVVIRELSSQSFVWAIMVSILSPRTGPANSICLESGLARCSLLSYTSRIALITSIFTDLNAKMRSLKTPRHASIMNSIPQAPA
jgi:hypothetical protein